MIKDFKTKDSGRREQFNSGAVRDVQKDKPRFDLIPPGPLERLAMLYGRGAEKYDEHNWTKGIPVSRCIASLLRHVFQFIAGDASEDHLIACVFNIFCIIHYEETNRTDLDDRFDWKIGKKRNDHEESQSNRHKETDKDF